jgi:O-antigen ligase
MSESPTPSASPPGGLTADDVWRWGRVYLGIGLACLLALTLAVTVVAPRFAPLVPLGLAGALALGWLIRRPLLHLCFVMLSLVFVLDLTEGIRVSEVVVTLYYLSYLGGWFTYHLVLRQTRLLTDPVDYAVAAFIGIVTLSLGLTVIYGGSLFVALNEWRRILVVAFYFPLKWMCLHHPKGFRALLITFVVIALILVTRNLLRYYFAFQSAEALWQIMTNRARTNERFIMIGFLGSLIFLFHTNSWHIRAVFAATTIILFSGTIAGLSRALWVATAFGLFVALILMEGRQRLRVLLLLGGAAASLSLAAMVLFDDAFTFVLQGLVERFATLESAASDDISLINRFYEWRSAWDRIVEAPLFGHGLGVKYPHFNLIWKVTQMKTFVHSTYVALLYRHGLIGVACISFIVLVSFSRAVLLLRTPSGLSYPVALTAVTVFPALAVAALTEDLLLAIEGAFTLAFIAALLTALWVRRSEVAAPPAETSSS